MDPYLLVVRLAVWTSQCFLRQSFAIADDRPSAALFNVIKVITNGRLNQVLGCLVFLSNRNLSGSIQSDSEGLDDIERVRTSG